MLQKIIKNEVKEVSAKSREVEMSIEDLRND